MVMLAFQLFSKYKIAMNEQIKHDSYLYNGKLRYTYSLLEIEVDVVFSLLDNWQKINADPVCFGGKNDSYGAFYVTKTGHVNTMKLVHKNGSIHNLVPRGCVPFGQHQGSKTSGLINVKIQQIEI